MNWFNKIKKTTEKVDNSLELKRGEIKQILIQVSNAILPDFKFLVYKKGCYTFQRIRKVDDLEVYELLHIIFSLKDKNFACSIASRLNLAYSFSNHYNTGLLNPHIDLKVLKHNSGVLNIQDAYYFHNGHVETTTKTVIEIFGDFKKYGLPFLDKQIVILKTNKILKCGFEYIDKLQSDKDKLKKEITEELNKCGLLVANIKHPIYIALKDQMNSVSRQTKEDSQKISKTAHELLEIYWTR